jgi:ribosomal protein S18 acetylase RimI-like enzyme
MTSPTPDSEKISLRPELASDEPFLLRLYASTREEEMALLGGNEAQAQAFAQMQFNFQKMSYEAQFPAADRSIVLAGEQEIGRIIVDRTGSEHHFIDIALLPEFRGRGIGGALLGQLQQDAARDGKGMRLSVRRDNPARRLYERMGFSITSEDSVYLFMNWSAPDAAEPG